MTGTPYFPYVFEAELERFGVGKDRVIGYTVIMVPDDIRARLPLAKHPRLRVEGEIADMPVENAFMPTGDGRHYVIVAPAVLKGSGAKLGDPVEMRFRIADQDHVDVPVELNDAVRASDAATRLWEALTPGKKRMLAQHVRAAKTAPTRTKRVQEAMAALLNHGADLRAWRKAVKAKA